MNFLAKIILFLDTGMPEPTPYGWFHLLFLALTIIVTVFLCKFHDPNSPHRVHRIVFGTAVLVTLLEIYKQINFTFSVENGRIIADFPWYSFPFQFCSTPMYVGLLTGIFRKGKVHDALYAFLATYSIFAGLSVMLYPVQIFISTVGINIQTCVCHGSMIAIGIYLLYTGSVKLEHKTILKAILVFAGALSIAMLMNVTAHLSGLEDTFNMFYVSPFEDPSLPVYSLVQELIPFPFCLFIYFAAFTLAAYLILLIAMGVKKCFQKNDV